MTPGVAAPRFTRTATTNTAPTARSHDRRSATAPTTARCLRDRCGYPTTALGRWSGRPTLAATSWSTDLATRRLYGLTFCHTYALPGDDGLDASPEGDCAFRFELLRIELSDPNVLARGVDFSVLVPVSFCPRLGLRRRPPGASIEEQGLNLRWLLASGLGLRAFDDGRSARPKNSRR